MSARALLLAAWSAAVLWALCLPGAAQDTADDQLARRVEELRQELATETAELEREQAAADEELAALRAERRAKATELLQLSLAESAGAAALLADEEEAARAERELQRALEELDAVQAAGQTALERLVFAARGVPARASRAEEARTAAIDLAAARAARPDARALLDARAGDATAPPMDWGLTPLRAALAATGTSLDEASRLLIEPATLVTASGREEAVTLLHVGWIGRAYRTADGRLGLALASPVDADGYRWSEALDDDTKAQLQAAFAAAEGSGAEGQLFPLDPTGQLRPSALEAAPDLKQRLIDGGPLMLPLGLVALAAILLALERVVTLFLRNRRAHGLAHEVIAAAEARRLDEAASLCDSHAGILPRTLGACLARADQSKEAMEDAVQEQLLHELPIATRFLRTLAILAAVAPLVGLLGTVTGIIQTFGVIKALGTTDPTQMAGGISVALVTTAAGLSVAIPTMLVQGLLKGRGERLIADAERYAASLLTTLAHGDDARA